MGWEAVLNQAFLISLFAATLRLAAPLLFAALGENLSERAGVLNLGLEGIMLIGTFAGFSGVYFTGNLLLGVLSGLMVGGLMGLLMALWGVSFRANQIVVGMAIWLFGMGLTTFLSRTVFAGYTSSPTIKGFETIDIPLLSQIPLLGPILFQQNVLLYLALIMVPIFAIFLSRTTLGLKIRAVGENPRAADILGVSVYRARYLCVTIGGMMAGLAGATLTLSPPYSFVENMVSGRGFIAVALVIFSKWNPYMILVGALIFAGANALQLRLQPLGLGIPSEFFAMLPYLFTVIALMLVSRKARAPAALGVPYIKGQV